MSDKHISVCIPAYDAEASIARTIKNVLLQTYRDFRVVVYDDGSRDGTPELVRELAHHDSRVSLIEGRTNKGRSAARNALLEYCRHDLIAWQDADDLWHPRKLERLLPVYEDQALRIQGSILYSSIFRIPPKYSASELPRAQLLFGKQIPMKLHPPEIYGVEHVFSQNFGTCPFYLQGTLGPADSYIQAGGFDESLGWAEDLGMVVRLIKNGFRIYGHRTEHPLTRYYLNVPSVPAKTLCTAILKAAMGGLGTVGLSVEQLNCDLLWRKMFYVFKIALLQKDFELAESITAEYHEAVAAGGSASWGPELLARNSYLLKTVKLL